MTARDPGSPAHYRLRDQEGRPLASGEVRGPETKMEITTQILWALQNSRRPRGQIYVTRDGTEYVLELIYVRHDDTIVFHPIAVQEKLEKIYADYHACLCWVADPGRLAYFQVYLKIDGQRYVFSLCPGRNVDLLRDEIDSRIREARKAHQVIA